MTEERMHSIESENTETKTSYYLSVGRTQGNPVFTSQHTGELVYIEVLQPRASSLIIKRLLLIKGKPDIES